MKAASHANFPMLESLVEVGRGIINVPILIRLLVVESPNAPLEISYLSKFRPENYFLIFILSQDKSPL